MRLLLIIAILFQLSGCTGHLECLEKQHQLEQRVEELQVKVRHQEFMLTELMKIARQQQAKIKEFKQREI